MTDTEPRLAPCDVCGDPTMLLSSPLVRLIPGYHYRPDRRMIQAVLCEGCRADFTRWLHLNHPEAFEEE